MQSKYQATCPQRRIVSINRTIATWEPVKLECGHDDSVNWTAKIGDILGCTYCQKELEEAKAA